MRRLKLSRQTGPQRQFWADASPFRLFRGGVGSGKTYAGAIECLRQPAGSVGMVLAPTYPMLQDASLRTFLDLARKGRVLKAYHKGERIAELAGNRTVFFRTADNPDRLRGPNLGWYWLDEGALMSPEVWPIMLGRRRLAPRRAWVTTTPRGNRNWTHSTFAKGGAEYATIVASSRTNVFQPAEFVGSMEANYSADFARQEIEGDVLDDAQEGLLPLWWLDAMEQAVRPDMYPGPRRMGVDLGYGTGRDATTLVVRDDLGILWAYECSYVGVPQAAQIIAEQSRAWGVSQEHITYDANGPGRDLPRYLEAYAITEAIPYHGSGKGGHHAVNKRSRVAWRLRQRLDPQRPNVAPEQPDASRCHPLFPPAPVRGSIQHPFCLPPDRPWWPRLKEELGELKYTLKNRQVALENKEDLAKRLKHSPDLTDALLMTYSDVYED